MRDNENGTRFLNVDLDIRGDAGDVQNFLRSIEPSAFALNHEGQFASIELAEQYVSLDESMMGFIHLIHGLQPDAKRIWKRLERRSINVGIQAACEPGSTWFAISAKTVELIAALQFEIIFTVYAPRAD